MKLRTSSSRLLPFFLVAFLAATFAQVRGADEAIVLSVDAHEATRGILHVHETIPGVAGEVKLVYPKWIPGDHAPTGRIVDLISVAASSGGERLTWRRDPVELYSFYVTVPPGKSGLDVWYDYVNSDDGQATTHRLSTPNILLLQWSKVVLTPFVEDYSTQRVAADITLPGPDWRFATALETAAQSGARITFEPVSLDQLVDSPLAAGLNSRRIALGRLNGAPVDVAIFADTQSELALPDKHVQNLKNLVQEMRALYQARHFNHYTWLVIASDHMPGDGIEHHQSSDNGTTGDAMVSEEAYVGDDLGDLLAHEFNHSWNGKYRRPAGLTTTNLQAPMLGDLLWVYEGMTQYYGYLQTERSGSWSKQQWLDRQARAYAELDSTTGRSTRPLLDTAVSVSFLYGASHYFSSARRAADYYDEAALMWLEADVLIRRRTGGKKSLDDFARAFFGRSDSGPAVATYTRRDVIGGLNAVLPYDWDAFFQARVDAIAPHPPNPFEIGGYRLVYRAKPNELAQFVRDRDDNLDARYSLGFTADKDRLVEDVIEGSPAALAGLGPGMMLLGINGRTLSDKAQDQLDGALTHAKNGSSIRLLLSVGGVYREITIDYRGGPRYPSLERIPNTPDLLSATAKPLR